MGSNSFMLIVVTLSATFSLLCMLNSLLWRATGLRIGKWRFWLRRGPVLEHGDHPNNTEWHAISLLWCRATSPGHWNRPGTIFVQPRRLSD